tara:strand:- start:208 stop:498 length:291 start_codon:yes stop_codon:yes gene_type:complete
MGYSPCISGAHRDNCNVGTKLALPTSTPIKTAIAEGVTMLSWAVTFFVVAIIAAILGFGGIAGAASGIAQMLFFIFVVLFVISLVVRALGGKTPPA